MVCSINSDFYEVAFPYVTFSVAFRFYSVQSVKPHRSCSPLHSLFNLLFALD